MGRECEACIGAWIWAYRRLRDLREEFDRMSVKKEVDWEWVESELKEVIKPLLDGVKASCDIPEEKARSIDSAFEYALKMVGERDSFHFWDALLDLDNFLSNLDDVIANKCQRERR